MSGHKQHIDKSLKDYLDYLFGMLTGRQRNSFEKKLERDEFESDALEGFASLSEEELVSDLSELKSGINNKIRKRKSLPYLRIAAGIAIIVSLSVSYFIIFDRQSEDFPGNYKLGDTKDIKKPETEQKDSIVEIQKTDVRENKTEASWNEKKGEAPTVITSDKKSMSGTEKEEEAIMQDEEYEFDFAEAEDEMVLNPVQENVLSEKTEPMTVQSTMREREESAVPAGLSRLSAKKGEYTYTNESIKGRVISGLDSLAVPGALISVKGSETVVMTDLQGNFEVIPEEDATVLVASNPGMTTREISVKEDGTVEIILQPEMLAETDTYTNIERSTKSVSASESRNSDQEISEYHPPLNDYKRAEPSAGYSFFRDYINSNIRFPEGFEDSDRAVVILKTIIDPVGRPAQIRVVKSPDDAFSEEAIRLIKEGPLWIPSSKDGKYLEEETRIRIVFKR